jgi:hypothetical protein
MAFLLPAILHPSRRKINAGAGGSFEYKKRIVLRPRCGAEALTIRKKKKKKKGLDLELVIISNGQFWGRPSPLLGKSIVL